MTVGGGRRCSAANAYLRPAMKRAKPRRAHRSPRDAHPVRWRPRDRHFVCPGRHGTRSARAARGDRERGLDQHAAIAEALRHRSRGGTARARNPRHPRPAGRRREPAGSPRVLFPGRVHAADHALFIHGPVVARADRRTLAGVQGRARRHQPFRDRRLHPQPRGRALPRHPVSLPAARGHLRRLIARERARLPGARRADAFEEPRPRSACVGGSVRKAEDPLQLPDPPGRHGRDARLRAAHARDLRAACLRPVSRARDPAGR